MSQSPATTQNDPNNPNVDIFYREKTKDLSLDASKVDDEKEHAFVESPVPHTPGGVSSSQGGKGKQQQQQQQKKQQSVSSPSPSSPEQVYDPDYFAVNEVSDQQTNHDHFRELLDYIFPNHPAFNHDRGLGLIFITTVMLMTVFMGSIMCALYINPSNWRFWSGITFVSAFHLCEYFVNARNQPELVTYKSFFVFHPMLNSARLAYIIEYWVWSTLAPQYVHNNKLSTAIALAACGGCVLGQLLRSVSMWQLKDGFTYCLARKKRDNHELKTDGVYQFVRHPSYTGILLLLMSCGVVFFAPITMAFFIVAKRGVVSYRCDFEEEMLDNIFGKKYEVYKRQVPWRLVPKVY